MIDPKQVIKNLTVEELCQTAEDYYANISDPTFHISKPFSSTLEAPEILYLLGLLLSGLRLGKTMSVLEFGSGTCWLARSLNQMQCTTICVDPSTSALKMGQQLFETWPILGGTLAEPQFLPFNGYTIDVPDESVDRIINFATFHHVPNQEHILREFFRVLKPGGIIGFCEPGPFHSQAAQSQYEMQNYNVLENDIILSEIKILAEKIGFSDLRVKVVHEFGKDYSFQEYQRLTNWGIPPLTIFNDLRQATLRSTVFFFTKGVYYPDSRSHIGLAHQLTLLEREAKAKVGQPFQFKVHIKNSGGCKWLTQNIKNIGVVNLGVHLYNSNRQLLDLDFSRTPLPQELFPGQEVILPAEVKFTQPGKFQLALDLVAEQISWFEPLGCKTIYLDVEVSE